MTVTEGIKLCVDGRIFCVQVVDVVVGVDEVNGRISLDDLIDSEDHKRGRGLFSLLLSLVSSTLTLDFFMLHASFKSSIYSI